MAGPMAPEVLVSGKTSAVRVGMSRFLSPLSGTYVLPQMAVQGGIAIARPSAHRPFERCASTCAVSQARRFHRRLPLHQHVGLPVELICRFRCLYSFAVTAVVVVDQVVLLCCGVGQRKDVLRVAKNHPPLQLSWNSDHFIKEQC